MQRQDRLEEISVCTQHSNTVRALAAAADLRQASSGQSFCGYPAGGDSEAGQPDLHRELIARMPPRNIVVAAVPDQLHFEVILEALRRDQHICEVKPLVLKHAQAAEIGREAYARGLIVGARITSSSAIAA